MSDRYVASTLAYQGYGRGVDLAQLRAATELAIGACRPDLTILIDLPLDVAVERRTFDAEDRFEVGRPRLPRAGSRGLPGDRRLVRRRVVRRGRRQSEAAGRRRRSTSASPLCLVRMPDVFDTPVGQDRAVASMRQHAKNPVHAYLLSGPVGSGLHDAALTFAAALQCPEHGCGHCERVPTRVERRSTPTCTSSSAPGVSWRVDEIREAERVGRRRPLGAGYQIVVIEDVELTTTGASPSAPPPCSSHSRSHPRAPSTS